MGGGGGGGGLGGGMVGVFAFFWFVACVLSVSLDIVGRLCSVIETLPEHLLNMFLS